ncbi:MAG: hypothetical protein ABFR53_13360, partial [Actinomycetota bacterium]
MLAVGEAGNGELALRSSHNNGTSVLLSAQQGEMASLRLRDGGELERLALAVSGTGQGSLVITGSEGGGSDETRVELAVDDEDSGFLHLHAGSNEQTVAAESIPGAPDHGRLRVALQGTTAGLLQASPTAFPITGARGGHLVLYRVSENQQGDTANFPTILLDGRTGNIFKSGFNAFLIDHPKDPNLAINYVSLEGRQADIYARETITLDQGEARWEPPDDWSMLVRPESITVHCTPNSVDAAGVAIVSRSPSAIEIRALRGGSDSFDVDCLAFGTRNDIDLVQTIRPRADFAGLEQLSPKQDQDGRGDSRGDSGSTMGQIPLGQAPGAEASPIPIDPA